MLYPFLVTLYDTQMPELSYVRSFRTFEEVEQYIEAPLTKCKGRATDPETWISSFDESAIVVVKVI